MEKQLKRKVSAALSAILLMNPVCYVANADTIRIGNIPKTHYLEANSENVRWGNIGKGDPVLTVNSGDIVTVEAVTHHSGDDYERMIKGDIGVEDIFHWSETEKHKADRGPGVHIMTGPIAVEGAEPGDVLEVKILDMKLRPNGNGEYAGKTYGSNVAANWGLLYGEMEEAPSTREVVTIYEMQTKGGNDYAKALYNYRWTPQTDPDGMVHPTIDYPGVIVDHSTVDENHNVLKDVLVPVRLHFGTMSVAPKEADVVDSVPPSYYGGNIDDWRVTEGATMYYPVSVPGALLSVGDPHAGQGDSELNGTAIETSVTGDIQIILHKKAALGNKLKALNFPLLENENEWVVHGFSYANHLAELGEDAQTEIFKQSSLDKAMKDAANKTKSFLMRGMDLTEDEAYSLMSVTTDFGVTQVVDGNWGIHGIISKKIFGDKEQKGMSLRTSFEQFGADITWEPATKMITIQYNGNTLSAKIGATTATFNGKTIKLTAPIQLNEQKSAEVSDYFVTFYQAKLSKTE
ncbi:acetamidase/formamidase family protein [Paenibacillus pabuli]|uniref:acetamidase/formamidase family protein n=1 Tax=Paenibacillus pabuli TaxID=1472 RepID=UPI001FFFBA8B|nr:acetamidase/formamidase family protein [Paenibacillus pabuli]UPK46582.1 acetamidase/formamidase family protein [Paenibacillus pabuli]